MIRNGEMGSTVFKLKRCVLKILYYNPKNKDNFYCISCLLYLGTKNKLKYHEKVKKSWLLSCEDAWGIQHVLEV